MSFGPPGSAPWESEPVHVSVTDAISRSFEHTKKILFPFDLGKWLTLGFVAWLAQLGEGGGGNLRWPDTGGGPGGGPGVDPVLEWIRDNVGLVVAIAVIVVVVGLAIGLVLLWINSRAKLMFVDCVVNDRAAVKEPWARWGELGKRLFWFRFWLSLIGLAGFLVALGVGAALAWPDISAGTFGRPGITGAIVGGGLLVLVSIPLLVIAAVLEDFVVPTMYLHQESVRPAWQRVRDQLFRGHGGTIVVFYLMKIALSVGVGLIAVLATCITCCIAALPYIGTVILLPLFVFMRSYPIFFIEQFGPEWRFVQLPEPPPY